MNEKMWWRAPWIALAICIFGLEGVGGYEYVEHQRIEQIAQAERSDNSEQRRLDREVARLEATEGFERRQVHTPGRPCVCLRTTQTGIDSRVCELGEDCDEVSAKNCETQHKGFSCAPEGWPLHLLVGVRGRGN